MKFYLSILLSLVLCLLFKVNAEHPIVQLEESCSNVNFATLTFLQVEKMDCLNQKAKQKIGARLSGQEEGNKMAEERQKFWARQRKDSTGIVPMQKYVEAKEFFKSNLHQKRASTLPDFESIGPTANKADGGRTRAILVQGTSPQTIYVGAAAGGVWKSTNGGTSWTSLTDFIESLAITNLVQQPNDPTTIYAGTGEGFFNLDARIGAGIFKTTNSGSTWTQLSGTANSNFYFVNRLLFSPTSTSLLYAATRAGVFSNNNNGEGTWTSLIDSLSGSFVGGFLEMATTIKDSNDVILVWEGGWGLRQSLDGGVSWNLRFGVTGSQSDTYWRGSIAVAPTNPERAYACQSDTNGVWQNLLRSDDYGTSWTNVATKGTSLNGRLNAVLLSNPLFSFDTTADTTGCCDCFGDNIQASNQGWYDNVIAVDPTNKNRVYVGGIDVWRSDDAGVTFNQISNWWLKQVDSTTTKYLHADQHAIVFSPNYATDHTIYFGNDGGIAKSTNPTATGSTDPCSFPVPSQITFTQLNNGYGTLQFYHGSVSKTGSDYVCGAQDNGSWKFKTGTEWLTVNGGDGGFSAIDQNENKYFYSSNTQMTITRSLMSDPQNTNNGNQAILSNNLSGGTGLFINPFIMDPVNSKILYTTNDYLWKTSDATTSNVQWSSLGFIANQASISAITITPKSEKIYLGSENGNFYVKDLKSNSAPVEVGGSPLCSGCYISSIVVDPVDSLNTVYLTVSTFGADKLWVSHDGGSSWESMDNGLIPDIPVLHLYVDDQSQMMILGTDLGILVSYNAGASWQADANGFGIPNTPVSWFTLQASSRDLLAFTHGRGVYKVRVPGVAPGAGSINTWKPILALGMILFTILFVQF